MKSTIAIAAILFGFSALAQDNTVRLTVISYQWTTTHHPLNFTWPGHANTSCDGTSNINGYVSGGGTFSANGTSNSTCSTIYTPPSNQTIDIQKPVVYILAETENRRMVLTCTRNVAWSQCEALNPGRFLARTDNGHFEVHAVHSGKEVWTKYDIVQQTAITNNTPQAAPPIEAPASIQAPSTVEADSSPGFPSRWKSMTSGSVRTLRFEGDYIYGETVLPETAAKAGAFSLMEVKKDGDKYVGAVNSHHVRQDGASCSVKLEIELSVVTPGRIEGRLMGPPLNAKLDAKTCTYSQSSEWQPFTWIPVQ